MKRYLLKLLAFVSLQCVIGAFMWHDVPLHHSDHFLAKLADKDHALLHQPGTRLLIVGGSSVAFGICSPEFKQRTGLTPINVGLHAGTGLEFMLRQVESHVAPGDVVLLCPEFHLISRGGLPPNPVFLSDLLGVWPSAARYMPSESLPSWKAYGDRLALRDAHQCLRVGWVDERTWETPQHYTHVRYARSSFNEFGDMVGHYGHKPFPFDMPKPMTVHQENVMPAVDRINRFAEICQRKEARVFFAYPPLLQGTQPEADKLHRILTEHLNVPILHHPDECTFAVEDFFDTPLHLAQEGAAARSRFLANRLQQQMPLAEAPNERVIRR